MYFTNIYIPSKLTLHIQVIDLKNVYHSDATKLEKFLRKDHHIFIK